MCLKSFPDEWNQKEKKTQNQTKQTTKKPPNPKNLNSK